MRSGGHKEQVVPDFAVSFRQRFHMSAIPSGVIHAAATMASDRRPVRFQRHGGAAGQAAKMFSAPHRRITCYQCSPLMVASAASRSDRRCAPWVCRHSGRAGRTVGRGTTAPPRGRLPGAGSSPSVRCCCNVVILFGSLMNSATPTPSAARWDALCAFPGNHQVGVFRHDGLQSSSHNCRLLQLFAGSGINRYFADADDQTAGAGGVKILGDVRRQTDDAPHRRRQPQVWPHRREPRSRHRPACDQRCQGQAEPWTDGEGHLHRLILLCPQALHGNAATSSERLIIAA